MSYRELTEENLRALGERGQLLAVIVTPELLAEMLGRPMNREGDIVLDTVSTWDDYVQHTEHQREYLVVTPVIRLRQRQST